MQVNELSAEEAAKLTILSIKYRARCTAVGCQNLAQTILRYADLGGGPLSNLERCNRHTREAFERDRKAGLTIYDERERSEPAVP
jgi:hypothetical protein